MCVLVLYRQQPALTEIEAMMRANPHGAGVAWREGELIRWLKGITHAGTAHRHVCSALRKSRPVLFHARLDSVGSQDLHLCHPFPVGGDTAMSGGTAAGVLAHNGHLVGWETLRLVVQQYDDGPKDGPWSDTRVLALLAGLKERDAILRAVGQRLVVMTPASTRLYGGWATPAEIDGDGNLYSNHVWTQTPVGISPAGINAMYLPAKYRARGRRR